MNKNIVELNNLKIIIRRKEVINNGSISDEFQYLKSIVDNKTLEQFNLFNNDTVSFDFDLFGHGVFLNYFKVIKNIDSIGNVDEDNNKYLQIESQNLMIKIIPIYNMNATHIELENLERKIGNQKHIITNLQTTLNHKNKELDALNYVWCTGGCDKGINRYYEYENNNSDINYQDWLQNTKAIMTSDFLDRVQRHTKRLESYYINFWNRQYKQPINVDVNLTYRNEVYDTGHGLIDTIHIHSIDIDIQKPLYLEVCKENNKDILQLLIPKQHIRFRNIEYKIKEVIINDSIMDKCNRLKLIVENI